MTGAEAEMFNKQEIGRRLKGCEVGERVLLGEGQWNGDGLGRRFNSWNVASSRKSRFARCFGSYDSWNGKSAVQRTDVMM